MIVGGRVRAMSVDRSGRALRVWPDTQQVTVQWDDSELPQVVAISALEAVDEEQGDENQS